MNIKHLILTAGFVAVCAGQAFAQESATAGGEHVTVAMVAVVKAPEKAPERGFSPDYSYALTPAQMTAAWNAEAERFVPLIPST